MGEGPESSEKEGGALALARLLADTQAGREGAAGALEAWLRAQLEPLLRRRLTQASRPLLADVGTLVQQHWASLAAEAASPAASGKRHKGAKSGKGAPMPSRRGARADVQAHAGSEAVPGAAGLEALHPAYVDHATRVMQRMLRQQVARSQADATPPATSALPALRALEALSALDTLEPRLAQTVRLRWFGALDADASARLLQAERVEVLRRWYLARAFLSAAAKGAAGTGRARKANAGQALPMPEADEWARLAMLFETGTELPGEVRETWLASRQAEEPPATMRWLRGMLEAANAPEADKAIERGPRLPPWQDGGPDESTGAGSGPDTPLGIDTPITAGTPQGGAQGGAEVDLASAPALATGMSLGPWRLLGPMTASDARVTQWRARDDRDVSGADVALLVPRQWRAGGDLAQRLAAASRAPRALLHPHIARFVAVGVAEGEVPWFAAELAEGQPIERWCRDHGLDLHQRQRLMEQALEAVRFGHGHLVLHGQVHPSQIVVMPDGKLRWLNFGLTALLSAVGAPPAPEGPSPAGPPPRAYAAPEDPGRSTGAAGDPPADAVPSTGGEVHALGLVLFEVISGASPWQPPTPGETLPLAAGTHWRRPSDLAAAARLRRALRGDFDAIVAKATQIDPRQRYGSVSELLDDLRRAGTHETVAAAPGGARDGARRLARRHPWLAVAALSLVAVCVLAVGALSWQSFSWLRQREEALAAWRGQQAVSQLLLGLASDGTARGSLQAGPDLLARAEQIARSSLKIQPASLGSALALLGRQHVEQGRHAEGRNLLAESLPMLADAVLMQEAVCDEAWAQARQGDAPDEAEKRIRRGAESASVPAVARARCLVRLADLERRSGRLRDAWQSTYEARGQWDRSPEKPPQLALQMGMAMGPLGVALGRHHEARAWIDWTMTHADALQQTEGPAGVELREQRGAILLAAGDAEGALKLADANLTALTGAAFPTDADAAAGPPAALYYAAAEPRLELHRLAEARARLERALALAEARGDTALAERARCMMSLAAMREQDLAAAERGLKSVTLPGVASWIGRTSLARPVGGPASGSSAPITQAVRVDGATLTPARETEQLCRAAAIELTLAQGHHADAQRDAERLLAAGEELAPRLRASLTLVRAEAAIAAGSADRALALSLQALQEARALHPAGGGDQKPAPSFRSGQAAVVLAEAHRAGGDVEEAKKALDYAMQQLSATLPAAHPWRQRAEALRATLAVHAAKKP